MHDPMIAQPVDTEGRHILHSLRLSRMILPIGLGVAAVIYLFYRQFDVEQFSAISWSGRAFGWIGIALLLLIFRHLFNAYRLFTITRGYFSFRKCIKLMILWEFSGALTPTSKGGPFVMLFILTREKLPAGHTAAAVFYTLVCDSGFFVLLLPVLLTIYGPPMLYPGMQSYHDLGLASGAFFVTYSLMVIYWLLLVTLLLVRPQFARQVLHWLGRRRWLQRWASKINRLGDEFSLAAQEIRSQTWHYHLQIILSTLGAWTSKFILINCLIIALVPGLPIDGSTQAFLYARLVAMFTIMTFSPTPGGAGLAEVALAGFISDFVPKGVGLVVALLWRGMAYYGYLLLGAFVVPAWVGGQLAAIRKSQEVSDDHPQPAE